MIKKVTSLINILGTFNPKTQQFESLVGSISEFLFLKTLDLFHYYAQLNLEVMVWLWLHKETNTWRITVPRQLVTTYDIHTSDTFSVDINTGEELRMWEYYKVGTFHSHHSLNCVFSGTDDQSDYKAPAGLHLLIGNICPASYSLKASIVMKNQRIYIPSDIYLPTITTYRPRLRFHPFCLDLIEENV